MPRNVNESLGLFRDRISSSATDSLGQTWWDVYDDETAVSAVTDMARQLAERWWETLEKLSTRPGMMQHLRDRDLGHISGDTATSLCIRGEAALLTEDGPSFHLTELLRAVMADATPATHSAMIEFTSWAEAEAGRRTKEP